MLLPDLDMIPLSSIRSMLRTPRYLEASPFLCHLPMLFWLIEEGRPQRFVQIGLGDAVPYFAACQAMDELGGAPECHGFGLGDVPPDRAGAIRTHSKLFYPRISRLSGEPAEEALDSLRKGSVDLLLLDFSGLDGASTLDKDWSSILSPGGMVAIHGVKVHPTALDAISRLAKGRSSIALEEGEGLSVILPASGQLGMGARLAALTQHGSTKDSLCGTLVRLGALVQAGLTKAAAEQHMQYAQDELLQARNAQSEAQAEIERLKWQAEEAMQTQAMALARRDSSMAAARREVETLKGEVESLREQATRRDFELEQLTRLLDPVIADAEVLRYRVFRLEQERDALLASTSWKLTAPIRSAGRLIQRWR